jgi:hypothetical protein
VSNGKNKSVILSGSLIAAKNLLLAPQGCLRVSPGATAESEALTTAFASTNTLSSRASAAEPRDLAFAFALSKPAYPGQAALPKKSTASAVRKG